LLIDFKTTNQFKEQDESAGSEWPYNLLRNFNCAKLVQTCRRADNRLIGV